MMRGRVEVGVLVLGVVLALFTGWTVFFGGKAGGDASATAASGDGQSWVVVKQGQPVASAGLRTVSSPSPTPTLALPATAAPGGTAPSSAAPCTGVQQTGQLGGLTVVPGPGTATVTWYNPGDPALVEYELTAMPQIIVSGAQPSLRWQPIKPGAGCRMMTATVTGLSRGAPYVFSLDVVSRNYNADGNRTVTVARSTVIETT
jgi:hypothetical protein